MATVTVVRYKRRKRISDADSPMVFALKPKSGESKIYSIEALAREIETIGSLSVEDVSHVMKSFVRAMKKVLVAGNKVKVEGLGIFYTTLTCPGVELEKDCTALPVSIFVSKSTIPSDWQTTVRPLLVAEIIIWCLSCSRIRRTLREVMAAVRTTRMVLAEERTEITMGKLRIRRSNPAGMFYRYIPQKCLTEQSCRISDVSVFSE